MLAIITLPVLNDNYSYLLHDPVSGDTAVVDPAEAAPIQAALAARDWRLSLIFNTHHHHDHVGGNQALQQQFGCRIVASAYDQERIPGITDRVNDGDCLQLGADTIKVIATPGHTLGHCVYYLPNRQALFCGDTLFSMGCGRLFEGSAAQLWQSLQALKALPDSTQVYCAHEYTQANGRFALHLEPDNLALQQRIEQVTALRAQQLPTLPSSMAQEKATNPFLREDSPRIRQRLGLSASDDAITVWAAMRRLKDQF